MEWINRKVQEPSTDLKSILIWGKCGCPHIVCNDYDEWCHIEYCIDGHFHSGPSVEFEWWQPVPEAPKGE